MLPLLEPHGTGRKLKKYKMYFLSFLIMAIKQIAYRMYNPTELNK